MSAEAAGGAVSLAGAGAVVTGASSGIGLAVAHALADAGARLVLVARREAPLEAAARALDAAAVAADVADAAAVARLADAVARILPAGPRIVVNAAGAFDLAPLAETPLEDFDRMLAVNLRGPFLLLKAFLPGMLRARAGHVVTIGSVAGRQAFPHNGAYAASKFGVRGLHAVLDAELRGTGVRATLVEPAATDTPLWDAVEPDAHPGLPPRAAMLSPAAVADAVRYAVTRPPEVDVRNLLLDRS